MNRLVGGMSISLPPVEGNGSENDHDDVVGNWFLVIYVTTHIDCRVKCTGSDVSSPSGSIFRGPGESVIRFLT